MSSVFDSGDLKVVDELRKKLEALRLEFEEVEKSLLGAQQQLGKQAKSQKDLTKNTEMLIAEEKKLQQLEKQSQSITYNTIKAQEQNKLKRAQLTEQVRRENKELQQNQTFMQKMAGGVKAGIAQFALLAGAIGGGVTALIKFGKNVINSSGDLQDKWAVTVGKAKAITEEFFKAISNGASFGEMISNMRASADAAEKYINAMDRLNDLNRSLRVRTAEARPELASLDIEFRDGTKSITERQTALQKYLGIAKKLSEEEKELTVAAKDELQGRLVSQIKVDAVTLESWTRDFANWETALELGKEYNELYQKQFKIMDQDKRFAIQERILEIGNGSIDAAANLGKLATAFSTATAEKEGKAALDEYAEALVLVAEVTAKYEEENRKRIVLEKTMTEEINKKKDAEKESTEVLDLILKTRKEFADKQLSDDMKEIQAVSDKYDAIIAKATEADATLEQLDELRALKAKDILFTQQRQWDEYFDALMKSNEDFNNEIQGWTDEDQAALQEALNSNDELYLESWQKKTDAAQEHLDKVKEIEQELLAIGIDTAGQLFDLKQSYYDAEIQSIEKRRDTDIESYEKQGKDTTAIKKKYDKQIADVKLKQAKLDKAQALFNIGIDTATSIIKTGANLGYPAAIPFQVALGILGAIQAGIVLAQPLPTYFTGTKNHPGGLAVVGDAAPGSGMKSQTEFVQLPNGEGFIARNPMIMDLPRGSQVFTQNSPETKAALNQFNDKNIVSELRMLRKSMRTPIKTHRGWEFYNEETKTIEIQRSRLFR